MNKIKDKIQSIFGHFPLTLIIVFFLTIFLSITTIESNVSTAIVENTALFCIVFAISTFTTEAIMKKGMSKRKILMYILSLGISSLLTYLVNMENDMIVTYVSRIIITYFTCLLLFAIFALYKLSGQKFNEYLTRVATNIFKSGIIFVILAFGIAMVISVFCLLILKGKYMLILRAEILVFGLYFIPKLMYAFVDIDGEINKFFEAIFKYVLDTLVIIAFIIIYLYIAKIIILRDMPVNQIYRIIATLFILGVPIWTIASFFEDNKLISKVNKILPFAFIPFILLQIYSLGVRIIDNGLTELRYVGCMLILFEIIYIAMYIKNREKVGNSIIVLIVLSVITLIVPQVNMYRASNFSQYIILTKYDIAKDYSQEELSKFKGAYYYLKNSNGGKKLIDKALSEDEKDKLEKDVKYEDSYIGKTVINISNEIENVDIAQYNKLYEIDAFDYDKNSLEKAFLNVKCNNTNKSVDLSNIISNAFKSENPENYFKNSGVIPINDNMAIVIKYIYIMYDEENNQVTQYSIDGYLLEK